MHSDQGIARSVACKVLIRLHEGIWAGWQTWISKFQDRNELAVGYLNVSRWTFDSENCSLQKFQAYCLHSSQAQLSVHTLVICVWCLTASWVSVKTAESATAQLLLIMYSCSHQKLAPYIMHSHAAFVQSQTLANDIQTIIFVAWPVAVTMKVQSVRHQTNHCSSLQAMRDKSSHPLSCDLKTQLSWSMIVSSLLRGKNGVVVTSQHIRHMFKPDCNRHLALNIDGLWVSITAGCAHVALSLVQPWLQVQGIDICMWASEFRRSDGDEGGMWRQWGSFPAQHWHCFQSC